MPKVDRTCSANQVEFRTPYLDKTFVDFVETLPVKYRINEYERKYLLKKAFAGLLPYEVIYKKKQGFMIPRDEWFIDFFQDYIKSILLDKRSLDRYYFNKNALHTLLSNFFAGKLSWYTCSSSLVMSLCYIT